MYLGKVAPIWDRDEDPLAGLGQGMLNYLGKVWLSSNNKNCHNVYAFSLGAAKVDLCLIVFLTFLYIYNYDYNYNCNV